MSIRSPISSTDLVNYVIERGNSKHNQNCLSFKMDPTATYYIQVLYNGVITDKIHVDMDVSKPSIRLSIEQHSFLKRKNPGIRTIFHFSLKRNGNLCTLDKKFDEMVDVIKQQISKKTKELDTKLSVYDKIKNELGDSVKIKGSLGDYTQYYIIENMPQVQFYAQQHKENTFNISASFNNFTLAQLRDFINACKGFSEQINVNNKLESL